jgi:hypothetical protein
MVQLSPQKYTPTPAQLNSILRITHHAAGDSTRQKVNSLGRRPNSSRPSSVGFFPLVLNMSVRSERRQTEGCCLRAGIPVRRLRVVAGHEDRGCKGVGYRDHREPGNTSTDQLRAKLLNTCCFSSGLRSWMLAGRDVPCKCRRLLGVMAPLPEQQENCKVRGLARFSDQGGPIRWDPPAENTGLSPSASTLQFSWPEQLDCSRQARQPL